MSRDPLHLSAVRLARRIQSAVDLPSLKSATRAAIVIPAVFAFANYVIGKPETSVIAAFGSFALLVLVEFGGPRRTRLAAYGGLALVGAIFITLGTLCSRDPWLATAAMAVVGFVTLFAGAFGTYAAAGSTAAMLTFVLPVMIAAPNSVIADRLEGWGIAVVVGVGAAMLLWPSRQRADLRRNAAATMRVIADFAASDDKRSMEKARPARQAVDGLQRRFLGSQHRPTAGARATLALASLPDELDWLLSFLVPTNDDPSTLTIACAEDEDALAAIAAVLRVSADRLDGGAVSPDLARLDSAREAVAKALLQRLPGLPADLDETALMAALDAPFRIRAAAFSARQIAGYAVLATQGSLPEFNDLDLTRSLTEHHGVAAAGEAVIADAGFGSVWFQNSVRGAAGLAIAVLVAQQTGLQHGFWVVLGTLSVLRSSALSTGRSVISALAGTSAGVVAGALLAIAIGSHQAVFWVVLPPAILLAAYSSKAISFPVGQASFTLVVLVLFNIIQPAGWTVGVVRIEDVAIGFAISLCVGLLFWPRGAAPQLRRDLARAYAAAADFVVAAASQQVAATNPGAVASAEKEAGLAIHRLDDAFGQYLAEAPAAGFNVEDVAVLVGGASRVRRGLALSLEVLAAAVGVHIHPDSCAHHLDRELHALRAWYVTLGHALIQRQPIPPPHIRDSEGHARLIRCILDRIRDGEPDAARAAIFLLWASQHVDNLWRLEARLGQPRLSPGRATSPQNGAGRSGPE